MTSRLGIILATAAVLGSAALLVVGADAQQGVAPAPQPPSSDARPMPPPPGSGPRDFGPRGANRGPNGGGGMARFSPADRTAFFDAHIAAVKAGLELTPDQEKLWGPAEQAVRDAAKARVAQRQKIAQEGRPADPVARLRRAADAAAARGDSLHKLADAAQPLWASLSEDQKRRLPILMHGMRSMGMQRQAAMQVPNGMPPQDGQRQRMRGMMQMQRSGAPGGGDDRGQQD